MGNEDDYRVYIFLISLRYVHINWLMIKMINHIYIYIHTNTRVHACTHICVLYYNFSLSIYNLYASCIQKCKKNLEMYLFWKKLLIITLP